MKLKETGMRVVMATGDYSITAASIAVQVGILSDMKYDTFAKFRENDDNAVRERDRESGSALLLNGSEIDRLTSDEWKIIFKVYKEIVLSRATPNQKLLLVKEFQANDNVVLMAGDGVNDVPALKRANLSVAIGSGSLIAIEIASVVLLNNDIDGISLLLGTGRHTLKSIKKTVILFTISSVFCNYISIILNRTIGIPQLCSNLQMMFISSFINSILSVSLFMEKPKLYEYKYIQKRNLIDAHMLIIVFLFLGPLTTFFAYTNLFLYFKYFAYLDPFDLVFNYFEDIASPTLITGQSVAFYSIIILQSIGNLYSIRKNRLALIDSFPIFGRCKNLTLVISTLFAIIVGVTCASVSIPGVVFKIPLVFYALPLACSILLLLFNEIRKLYISRSLHI